jgi:ferritin-like metal-binding protein YciE
MAKPGPAPAAGAVIRRRNIQRRGDAMPMTELKELLKHELGDLLYAERRFLTSTKQISRELEDGELRQRVDQHVKETETQIERLQKAFEAIGEKAKAERCEGAIGLREEHDSFKSEESPSKPILQAFDLGSTLRVEHYEIAGYRSAIALAKVLGEEQCAEILRESLQEEEEMARFVERNAARLLKRIQQTIEA